MRAVRVTSKGQITIPIGIRESLGIEEGAYLEVLEADQEIRLRKIVPTRPLGPDDPIWDLIGAGESGAGDSSVEHDQHLADAEVHRWRTSS
ncbi:MAG: AbrB/MazE/SpoVT family DNA-binding domain-containing protein [Acidobacteria bacterium]|nr:AbrB/MazE/SpoVT family DNA-binding domain-containing protein [Acidobacteriota bacterium]